jgi:hypothetical protein
MHPAYQKNEEEFGVAELERVEFAECNAWKWKLGLRAPIALKRTKYLG